MYFNRKLWAFTEPFRHRIWGAVALGVVASALGIARLALIGWLLARVFAGASVVELALYGLAIAGTIVLRGVLEYARVMVAHRTAAKVQLHLREMLYDKIVELGPAYLGLKRTGEVVVASATSGRSTSERSCAKNVLRKGNAPTAPGFSHVVPFGDAL